MQIRMLIPFLIIFNYSSCGAMSKVVNGYTIYGKNQKELTVQEDKLRKRLQHWTLISSDTLYYLGEINFRTSDEFFQKITPNIRKVIIQSVGGYAIPSLKIGNYIFKHKINVTVDSSCFSSCANYIFLAGNNKVVPKGSIVAFHGNMHDIQNYPIKSNQDKIDLINEEKFMHNIGVSQKFFDCSVFFNEVNSSHFWIPEPYDYKRYGVKNLSYVFSKVRQDYSMIIKPYDKFTHQNTSKDWQRVCISNPKEILKLNFRD